MGKSHHLENSADGTAKKQAKIKKRGIDLFLQKRSAFERADRKTTRKHGCVGGRNRRKRQEQWGQPADRIQRGGEAAEKRDANLGQENRANKFPKLFRKTTEGNNRKKSY